MFQYLKSILLSSSFYLFFWPQIDVIQIIISL